MSLRSLFGKTRQIVGIDLGTGFAKAVVLERDLASGLIITKECHRIAKEKGDLADTLKRLTRRLETRCRSCAVSAWVDGSELRLIPGEIEDLQRISADARSTTRGGASPLIHDCQRLDSTESGEKESTLIQCSVPRAAVEQLDGIFRRLGFELKLLQLTPIAIFNAFSLSQGDLHAQESYLLVDIGKFRTNIVTGGRSNGSHAPLPEGSEEGAKGDTFREEDPFSFRIAPPGSARHSEAHGKSRDLGKMKIMRVVETGWQHVQTSLQKDFGISVGENVNTLSSEDGKVREAVETAMYPLAEEVARSLEYLEHQYGVSRPLRVFVSGALPTDSPLLQSLTESVGLPVTQWNPLRCTQATDRVLKKFDLLNRLPQLSAAAGAALQALQ